MARRKLTKEFVSSIALKFATRGEFQLTDKSAYLAAQTKGWLDEVCSHMEATRRTHTKESVSKIALLFKTRSEFAAKDSGAYSAARANGWLDDVCSHMEECHRTLDKETIAASAKRFQTRGEFEYADNYAHKIASKNGWLDEVCGHMRNALGGFDSTKSAYLYQMRFLFPNGETVWKVGITNRSPKLRLKELSAPAWIKSEIVSSIKYRRGLDAKEQEKRLHSTGRIQGLSYDGDPFLTGGHTELFTKPLM